MEPTERIRALLELQGLVAGTPDFERAERKIKVELCREKRAVNTCFACDHYEHCTVVRAYLRDEREAAFDRGLKQGQAHAATVVHLREMGGLGREEDS